jgi:hypothetical protein
VWADVGEGMAASTAAEVAEPSSNCNCLMILVTTGLQISEVAGLRVADIDLAAAY